MDTKWKKFSRSTGVRIFLNAMIILSMVVGLFGIAVLNHIQYTEMEGYEFSDSGLRGNKDLRKTVKTDMKCILEYVLKRECLGEGEDENELLKEMQENLPDSEMNYLITYDRNGENQTLHSKHLEDTESIKKAPIYISYKGMQSNKVYVKDWINQYSGKNVDFQWLKINELLREICQGNVAYSQYIAKQMVRNLEVYADNIDDLMTYCVLNESKFEKISNTTYEKIYGKSAVENSEFGRNMQMQGYVYDEETNYYYDLDNYERINEYYDYWEEVSEKDVERVRKAKEEALQEEELPEQDMEEAASLQKEEKKKEEENSRENPFGLTDSEIKTVEGNIEKAIFLGENANSEARISLPIAAILGTPEQYNISFGINEAYFSDMQATYDKKYDEEKQNYLYMQKVSDYGEIAVLLCILFFVINVVALFYVCGRSAKDEEVHYLVIDQWFTEVTCILEVIFGVATMCVLRWYFDSAGNYDNGETIIAGIVLVLAMLVMVEFACSLVRKAKGKCLLKKSLIGKIFDLETEKMARGELYRRTMMWAVVLPLCVGIVSFAILLLSGGFGIIPLGVLAIAGIFVGMWIIGVYYLSQFSRKLESIQMGVAKVRGGELSYQIPTDSSKGVLNQLARDINSMSEGLEHAVEDMVKSERLKTELISNVSHDIKTPLTSIITYVDLMKKEDVKPDKVKEYVDVLDQKSQRLKTLTDDLFEAAKATSGAMTMEATKLDLGSLVTQAVGEFEDKFSKNDLEVRCQVENEKFYGLADGRLSWRILENLLNNVSKYALAGSRVYVEIGELEQSIEVVVKNISCCELNVSADELMERFTRGDRSRNTEGSGLGLNIAQSLANLQNGAFHVEIDGDLFKAILELPKAE